MATFTDVFKRKEVKYRLSSQQHHVMLEALSGIMVPDVFGTSDIVSMYFDTPERSLIARSLEKPLYKEKLRLRIYGVPHAGDRVFLEIKKKYDGIVYKRRVGLSLEAARLYLGGMPYRQACAKHPLADPIMAAESLSARSLQIAAEIDRFLQVHGPLRASMSIACRRTAYASIDAPELGYQSNGLRITFDEDIAYRDMFASGEASVPQYVLEPSEAIMEVKSSGPFPTWLVQALSSCCAYPTSFSKYGEAYRACQCTQQQETVARLARAVRMSEANQVHDLSESERECEDGHRPKLGHGSRPGLVRQRSACGSHARSRAAHTAADVSSERLAADARDAHHRRFLVSDSNHSMKKGGRCA